MGSEKMGPDALAALSVIEATAATSQVKKYLMYYGSGKLSPDVIASALQKARDQNPIDLDLIHLQIFLFINHVTVQKLPGRFRKELLPLTPMNTTGGGIPLEFYAKLALQLNLHEQLLQMVLAMAAPMSKASGVDDLSKQIMSCVLVSLIRDFKENKIGAEVAKLYFLVLARLVSEDEDYMRHFKNLLDVWMNADADGPESTESASAVPKFDKVQMLLRLIGLHHLRNETLDKTSEVTELMTKTDFDPTVQFCESKTFKMFKTFYSPTAGSDALENRTTTGNSSKSGEFDEFKALLGKFTAAASMMELSDEEKVELSHFCSGDEARLGLLGQFAYINQLILQSRPETDTKSSFEAFINFWAQFKPKCRFEDFADSIHSFEDICRLLPLHVTNPRYQRRWFEEFLRCYPEAVETSAGLRTIESAIVTAPAPGLDVQLSVELINRLRSAAVIHADEGWGERVRTIILRIAMRAYDNGWKDLLVEGVYAGHAHDEFTTFGFGAQLKELMNKAGALEVDPKALRGINGTQIFALANELSEYRKTVFRLFFENPIECAARMVPAAVRARKFQVLHFVKPFLALKPKSTDDADVFDMGPGVGEFPGTPNLLESTLLALLKHEPQLEPYEKNLSLIVREGLLPFEQLYEVVFSVLEWMFCSGEYGRWLKVLRVWSALFDHLIENTASASGVGQQPLSEEVAERFVEDILRLVTCTWMMLGSLNHQPMLEGREKCLEMLELAKKHGLHYEKIKEEIPQYDDAALSLRQLGMLWFKCPAAWAMVTKHLLSPAGRVLIDGLNPDRLVSYMIPWVTNACRMEWNAVLDFAENLIRLKEAGAGDGEGSISIHSVVNYTLIKAFQPHIRMSHYLAFYAHFLRRKQQMASATVSAVAYCDMHKAHLNTVRTLLLLIQRTHKRDDGDVDAENDGGEEGTGTGAGERRRRSRNEYRSGIVQQALLLLHEHVEWVILKSSRFDGQQEELLELLADDDVLLSIEGEGCASSMSIYKAIVTKVKRGKDDSTVFERSVSTMAMGLGQAGPEGACVQVVKVAGGAALKPEILEKYASYYEHEQQQQMNAPVEGDEDEGQRCAPVAPEPEDRYPFHNTATEVTAKLSVQLKFED